MVSVNLAPLLKATRLYLYLSSLTVISIAILLPWSIVSYLKFYNMLIPENQILQVDLPLNYIQDKPFLALDLGTIPLEQSKLRDSQFDIQLELEYRTLSSFSTRDSFSYKVIVLDRRTFQEKVVHKLVSYHNSNLAVTHTWPFSQDISINADPVNFSLLKLHDHAYRDRLKRSHIKFFNHGKLFNHAALTKGYLSLTKWLPFGNKLAHSKTSISLDEGFHLVDSMIDNDIILLEFDSEYIHVTSASLKIGTLLTNLRFFLFNYYYISLIIGVTVFWCISVLITSLVGTLILTKFKSVSASETSTPRSTPIAPNRNRTTTRDYNSSVLANLDDLTNSSND